jgi:Rrf2 family nitric oxide-sensitive transcriptional repressor
MQLTRQSQIAVGILAACARAPNRYVHTHEASGGTGASKEHAAKIAHLLRRAGFVVAARGRHGGIKLARPAEAISLGAVLRHTEPELCNSARRDEPVEEEIANAALAKIVEAGWTGFVELMDRFSIADLVAQRAPQRTACSDCHLLNSPRNESLDAHALVAHR